MSGLSRVSFKVGYTCRQNSTMPTRVVMIAKPQNTTESNVGRAETHKRTLGNTRANANRPMSFKSAMSLYCHGAILCSYHSPPYSFEGARAVHRPSIVYRGVSLNSRQPSLCSVSACLPPCELYPRPILKTPGYCWPTYLKVLEVLFLGGVSSAFLPSKKA